MKNISFIINVVLFVAVAVLYLIVLKNKSIFNNTPSSNNKSVIEREVVHTNAMAVAYVDLDTILANYDLATELNHQLKIKKASLEEDLKKQASDFELEARDFQEKLQTGSFLSQARAEAKQKELIEKQQKLQDLDATYSDKILKLQSEMNKQLFDSLSNFLKIYNEKYNYQFILGHSYGGGILYGDKKLNITDTILTALNNRYKAAKKKK